MAVDRDPVATGPAAVARAAATLANGLPGASNFVPNNTDPVKASGIVGRYFDVTLGAAGTTTLDTTATIDRLSIANSAARLNVTSAGSLTSLIEINQLNGQTVVDGRVRTGGDYFLLGGLLSGSGRVDLALPDQRQRHDRAGHDRHDRDADHRRQPDPRLGHATRHRYRYRRRVGPDRGGPQRHDRRFGQHRRLGAVQPRRRQHHPLQ
ncbi:hypothetical protein [Sphingomonas hankookensis]|uniref:hypothetical protein n=1 Tax=Sphingomonas hankookensis TaxID=563996 RepID=UPI003D303638